MDEGAYAQADVEFGGYGLPPTGTLKVATSSTTERACQAEGCTAQLVGKYSCTRRLCSLHLRASHLRKRGYGPALFRFCQQCGKLQPLEAFDGNKRSCRERLRRRRTRAHVTAAGAVVPTRGANAAYDAAYDYVEKTALVGGSSECFWSEQLPGCGAFYSTDASGGTAAAAAADVSAGCMLMATGSDDDAAAAAATPGSVDAVRSKTLPTSASVGALDTLLLRNQAGDDALLDHQLRSVQAQLMAINERLLNLHQKRVASCPPALHHQYSGGHAEAHPLHAPAVHDTFIPATPGGLLLPRNNGGGDSALHVATTPLPGCATWQALPAAATAATATRTRRKSVRFDDPGAAVAADQWCAAAATAAKSAPIAGWLGDSSQGMPAMWQELLLEDLGAEKSSCENITSTDLLLPLTGCLSEPAMARATTPGGGAPLAPRTASDSSAAACARTGAWLMLQQPQQQQQQIMQQLVQHTQQLQNLSLAPAGALPGAPDATSTPVPTYTLSPTSCTAVAAVASPPAAVPAGRQHSSGASGGVATTFTAAPAVPAAHDAAVSGAAVRHQHSAEATDEAMEEFEDYLEIALLEAGAAALNNAATAHHSKPE